MKKHLIMHTVLGRLLGTGSCNISNQWPMFSSGSSQRSDVMPDDSALQTTGYKKLSITNQDDLLFTQNYNYVLRYAYNSSNVIFLAS